MTANWMPKTASDVSKLELREGIIMPSHEELMVEDWIWILDVEVLRQVEELVGELEEWLLLEEDGLQPSREKE